MTHTIKDSLAGSSQKYVVVEGNEGFRMRKLGSARVRVHIEKDAPDISSRGRLSYDVPYWAVDLNLKGLKEQIQLVENGEVEKFGGIEHVLAALTAKSDELSQRRDALRQKVKELEKEAEALVSEKKEFDVLKKRVTNGVVAYHDAQILLNGK